MPVQTKQETNVVETEISEPKRYLPLFSTARIIRENEKKIIHLRDKEAKPTPIILEYDKSREPKNVTRNFTSGKPVSNDLIGIGSCSRIRKVLDLSTGTYYADTISAPKVTYGLKLSPTYLNRATFTIEKVPPHDKKSRDVNKIIDYKTNRSYISLATLLKIRTLDERYVNTPKIIFMENKRKEFQINAEKHYLFIRRAHVLSDLGIYDLSEFVPENSAHALDIARHLIEAVCHLHTNLMVHRDIKPHNILCFENQLPKLIDFNLSIDFSVNQTPITSIAGTRKYLPPEYRIISRYNKAMNFDDLKKADIWSLGATLFNLFTSTHKNPRGDYIFYNSHNSDTSIPDITQSERDTIDRCLDKHSPIFSLIELSLLHGFLEPEPLLRISLEEALLIIKRDVSKPH